MPRPSSDSLTRSYYKAQISRVLATLNKLTTRPMGIGTGYVIPDPEDIAIHSGRRIEATVLFLDICKFSQRPCESQEEQASILEVISLFFTEMIHIIEDHGGVVEKNTGDGLMAYFARNEISGVSIQQRALSCALTMFAAAEGLVNPILERASIPQLDFRICMDHGLITVAKVGAARRFNGIVAIGTTANIASKMLAYARANTILMGQSMLAGLPPAWLQWVALETNETGWVQRQSQAPYRFWRYTGRWVRPTL